MYQMLIDHNQHQPYKFPTIDVADVDWPQSTPTSKVPYY